MTNLVKPYGSATVGVLTEKELFESHFKQVHLRHTNIDISIFTVSKSNAKSNKGRQRS